MTEEGEVDAAYLLREGKDAHVEPRSRHEARQKTGPRLAPQSKDRQLLRQA